MPPPKGKPKYKGKPPGWKPPKPKNAPPINQPPKPPKPKPPKKKPNKYTVKQGDNWFNIAQQQLGDQELSQNIVKVNPDVYRLKPGMVINLPGSPVSQEPQSVLGYDPRMRGRGFTEAQQLGYDPNLRGRSAGSSDSTFLDVWGQRYGQLQKAFESKIKTPEEVAASNAFGNAVRYGAQGLTKGLANLFGAEYEMTAQPPNLADIVRPLAAQQGRLEAQAAAMPKKSGYGGYDVPPKPVRPGEGPTGAVWGSEIGGVSDRPPVSPMTLAMIDQGVSPYRITEAEQSYLGFSDEDMQALGYEYQDGNWIVQPRVEAPPPSAGAYSGSAPYSYGSGWGGGWGGGGGGGGGGKGIYGRPASGAYRPPPGTFGLVTWRL